MKFAIVVTLFSVRYRWMCNEWD